MTGRSSSRAAGRHWTLPAIPALFVLAALTGACNQPAATSGPSSPTSGPSAALGTGVRGQVLAGPTCPVEQAGQSPCIRAVSGARIQALDSSNAVVATGISDAAGAYFLALKPGTYTIEPQPVEGLMGTARPVSVVVGAGPPARLDITYDTGIR
jgi:hypothetical protein